MQKPKATLIEMMEKTLIKKTKKEEEKPEYQRTLQNQADIQLQNDAENARMQICRLWSKNPALKKATLVALILNNNITTDEIIVCYEEAKIIAQKEAEQRARKNRENEIKRKEMLSLENQLPRMLPTYTYDPDAFNKWLTDYPTEEINKLIEKIKQNLKEYAQVFDGKAQQVIEILEKEVKNRIAKTPKPLTRGLIV